MRDGAAEREEFESTLDETAAAAATALPDETDDGAEEGTMVTVASGDVG